MAKARSELDKVINNIRLGVAGVLEANTSEFATAGADIFIVSNTIFDEDDYHTAIAELRMRAC